MLIDQQINDYAFSLHSNVGTRILVFSTQNFPDQTSGAVKEKFIEVGEEMFLSVSAMPIHGSEDIRTYDQSARNCVFDDEIRLIYEK